MAPLSRPGRDDRPGPLPRWAIARLLIAGIANVVVALSTGSFAGSHDGYQTLAAWFVLFPLLGCWLLFVCWLPAWLARGSERSADWSDARWLLFGNTAFFIIQVIAFGLSPSTGGS